VLAGDGEGEPGLGAIAAPDHVVAPRIVGIIAPRDREACDEGAQCSVVLVRPQYGGGLADGITQLLRQSLSRAGQRESRCPDLPLLGELLCRRIESVRQTGLGGCPGFGRAGAEGEYEQALRFAKLAHQRDDPRASLAVGPRHRPVGGKIGPAVRLPYVAHTGPAESGGGEHAHALVAGGGEYSSVCWIHPRRVVRSERRPLFFRGLLADAQVWREQRIQADLVPLERVRDQQRITIGIHDRLQVQVILLARVPDGWQSNDRVRRGQSVVIHALEFAPPAQARHEEPKVLDLGLVNRRPIYLVEDAVGEGGPHLASPQRGHDQVLGTRCPRLASQA
jgi:hypothetical protein